MILLNYKVNIQGSFQFLHNTCFSKLQLRRHYQPASFHNINPLLPRATQLRDVALYLFYEDFQLKLLENLHRTRTGPTSLHHQYLCRCVTEDTRIILASVEFCRTIVYSVRPSSPSRLCRPSRLVYSDN